MTIRKELNHEFNESFIGSGSRSFMKIPTLQDQIERENVYK